MTTKTEKKAKERTRFWIHGITPPPLSLTVDMRLHAFTKDQALGATRVFLCRDPELKGQFIPTVEDLKKCLKVEQVSKEPRFPPPLENPYWI